MAQLNFDARTVAPDSGAQDPLPNGWYNVVMDQSEMKPTSDGTGMRLAIRFHVIDGQYAGRKIFEGLNLKNSNAVAQEIAFKQLSAIAHAVGVMMVEDSAQLHNIPLKVKVKVKPASGSYEAGNSITAYKNINEQVQMAGTSPTVPGSAGYGVPPAAPQWAPPPAMPPGQAAFAAPAPAFVPPPAAPQWTPPAAPPTAPPAAPQWAPPAAPPAVPAAPAWTPPAAGAAPAAPAPAAPTAFRPPWETGPT